MNKIFPMALLVMMASGCSNDGVVDAARLADQRFILQSVDGISASGKAEKQPEISFTRNMRVSGMMCNRFFGQGELSSGQLTVKQLGSNRMLCSDPQLNNWDSLIGEVLMKGATVSLDGDRLTLTGTGHTLQYQKAK